MNDHFSVPMRVYIEDTDAGGIVYYVNYLKFMERSRTELFRSLGFPKPAVISAGKLIVVANVDIKYRVSAVLDDLLNVSTEISKVAKSYLVMNQEVTREENGERILLAQASVRLACVDRYTRRPCGIPKDVLKALNDYLTRDHTL